MNNPFVNTNTYLKFDSLPFLDLNKKEEYNLVISGPDNQTRFFTFVEGEMDDMKYGSLIINILMRMNYPIHAFKYVGITVSTKMRNKNDLVKKDVENLKTIRLHWRQP